MAAWEFDEYKKAESAWLPIEAAPKDQTEIIIWFPMRQISAPAAFLARDFTVSGKAYGPTNWKPILTPHQIQEYIEYRAGKQAYQRHLDRLRLYDEHCARMAALNEAISRAECAVGDPARKEIRITAEQKAVLVRDDGAIFYVMMEPSGLWLHVAAPEGKSPGRIEFEHNCGNGWVHCKLREPARTSVPLRQARR